MGEPFLSPGWFDLAGELASGRCAPVPGGADRIVQLDADGERWHLVVEGGALTAWAAGDAPGDPDLELCWPRDEAAAWHRAERSGTQALDVIRLADGRQPAPMDIGETAELAALPLVAGATLVVQYHLDNGPFGSVDHWQSFEDGRSVGLGLGRASTDPDAEVWITFQRMVAVRTGAITVLEALEDGGRVDGQVGPLMLLAGLEESPELHAAELACGPSGPVLADLGAALARPEQAAALDELARRTA